MKDKSIRSEVSKDRIMGDLRRIGVEEGDHVAVALSLKSVGYVAGGPEAFIDALLEAVGPKGTIMMNAHTQMFTVSDIPSDYIFDYRSTPTWTGLVPETFRKRRNSIRSEHPRFSVSAIGKLAELLTKGHDENSNFYMPFSTLAKEGGKYLCIGLGNRLVAIRHEAQRLAGLFDVVQKPRGVKYRDREGKVKVYFANMPPCTRKLPDLVPVLRKMGVVKTGRIGMAYSILAPAKALIDAMAEMLKKNPTLNLCDKISCIWCREAERKLALYKNIDNPKYFQKIRLMITTIALINRFRLKRYSFVSFRSWKGKFRPKESFPRRTLSDIRRILYLMVWEICH